MESIQKEIYLYTRETIDDSALKRFIYYLYDMGDYPKKVRLFQTVGLKTGKFENGKLY